jgi:GT2 family glycosyltransferase
MLDAVGLSVARVRTARALTDDRSDAFPAELDLSVVRRHPTTLTPDTVASVLGAPLPPAQSGSGATTPATSIVVVTHNNLVFTRLCLESVIANTAGSDIEIIVVDNASVDMTDAYLERLAGQSARVRYLRNDENLGFAAAVNQGLTAARGDVLVVLNNDTVVAPGWIDRLDGHLRDPAVGMVGPLTNCCPNEACIEVPYTTYGGFLRFAAERATIDDGQWFDIDMLTMFCVAFRRDVYERVGPLDERFEVGMFEDDDFALRVRGAGLRVVCAADVVVHHFGEASLGKLVSTGEHGRIFQANKLRFESKWARSWDGHRSRPDAEYDRLVAVVREAIMAVVPEGETVLVVSKGDEELLDVDGRGAWHFPQQDDGAYAGWYPANTREVTEHLGRLAGKGASYIVFPETAAWWFEFYEGLEDGFAQEFEEIGTEPSCRIFAIRQPVRAHGSAGR